MSDLSATNCGCGCSEGRDHGNNSCLWIILLLLFCGNGSYGRDNGCGCDCLILILLLFCCGNGFGRGDGGCFF